jgi:hypothetical protein
MAAPRPTDWPRHAARHVTIRRDDLAGRYAELSNSPHARPRVSLIEDAGGTTHAVSTTVDSLDAGLAVMNMLGFDRSSYRECVRTSFVLHQTTVNIDRWPGISAILQLTGGHPADVLSACSVLGYPTTRARSTTDARARRCVQSRHVVRPNR